MEYKVGDKVEVIARNCGDFGHVSEIQRIDKSADRPYKIVSGFWHTAEDLIPAIMVELAPATATEQPAVDGSRDLQWEYNELVDRNKELIAERKQLQAQLAAAQAALKPFATIYERWTNRLLIDMYFPEWLEIHLTVQEQQGWYTRQWFEAAAKELEATE